MWSILWEFSGPQLVQPYSAMLQGSLQKHCPLDLQWHLQFSSSYLPCDKDEVGKMEPQGVDVPRDKMWQFYYKKICVEFQSMEWSEREKDFFPGGVKKVKPEEGGPLSSLPAHSQLIRSLTPIEKDQFSEWMPTSNVTPLLYQNALSIG